MTLKEQFKKSLPFTWYLYLIALVFSCVSLPLAYSFMHRAQEYEKLSLFVPVNVKDDVLSNDIKDKLSSYDIKSVDVVSIDANENEYMFLQKLNVVGFNKCDVLILPENKLNSVNIASSMIEINSEIQQICSIDSTSFYQIEEKNFGVKIPDNSLLFSLSILNSYEDYYAFLGGNSWNLGEYSNKVKTSENGFMLMKYVLGNL